MVQFTKSISDMTSNFIEKVDSVIADNFHDVAFSIEALAKQVTYSYPHTYRKIKEETGLTPSVYIRRKRLERACYLLAETDLNISEIAYRVGFNTQAYFSKCFVLEYGFPPTVYKSLL